MFACLGWCLGQLQHVRILRVVLFCMYHVCMWPVLAHGSWVHNTCVQLSCRSLQSTSGWRLRSLTGRLPWWQPHSVSFVNTPYNTFACQEIHCDTQQVGRQSWTQASTGLPHHNVENCTCEAVFTADDAHQTPCLATDDHRGCQGPYRMSDASTTGPWIVMQECHALWYRNIFLYHNAQHSLVTIQGPVLQLPFLGNCENSLLFRNMKSNGPLPPSLV